MKFRVTMKTPDALRDSIHNAVCDIFPSAYEFKNIAEQEQVEESIYNKKCKIEKLCKKWFEYGEYVTLEIDTEKESCTVLEV